ncbi:hypothetical protein GCM10010384_28540 [Streptomyces djakartensis]|uniref:Uncharacterized protein n=1 Tax=Streptomyces djakartensis TaxID=68193 RepID=A0ABQ2ZPN1_9ACTN|nr:hypothetical protein GCM10010384_28540 [Streptomyces djakartensis]
MEATFLDIEECEAVCGDELIWGVTRYAVRHEPVLDPVPGREPVGCGHVAEFSSAGFSDDQRIRWGRQTLGEPPVERASDLPPELALVVDELLTAGGRPHLPSTTHVEINEHPRPAARQISNALSGTCRTPLTVSENARPKSRA